jgi:RNA polymerase sigma factor (sigma-70 family)
VRFATVTPPPFQWFLDEHRDDVYRFLVAAVGRQEADDCFQETFLSAMRAYPRLRANSNTRAWVLTIAHRKALDSHRARARRPVAVAEVADGVSPVHDDADEQLWGAVCELPSKQRAAIVLRFANDLPHGDIGRVLSCSEEAARRNVHEGIKRLREVMSQ